MPRVLVVYASSHGQTRKIARALADELHRAGHEVEIADALRAAPPPVADHDAVVLGSRVQFGVHARRLVEYRAELTTTPSYFFSVSMSAAGDTSPDPQGYLEKLFIAARWRPRLAAVFAGALPYRDYHFLLRWIMKKISQRGGHTTDTRRNHEYTDWRQVQRFAADLARDLATQVTAAPGVLHDAPAEPTAAEVAAPPEPACPACASTEDGPPAVEPPRAILVAPPAPLVAPAPARPAS